MVVTAKREKSVSKSPAGSEITVLSPGTNLAANTVHCVDLSNQASARSRVFVQPEEVKQAGNKRPPSHFARK
jgi:hypothetical protein